VSSKPSSDRPAPPRLHFSLGPEPSRLLRARERIRDYLTQHCSDEALVNDIVLAIEEAATNAIRHSGSPEDIDIQLGFLGDELRATVKDAGRGFDVDSFDARRLPDLMLDHGRGLYIISCLCDELELRCDGGLEVQLRKRAVLSPAPAGVAFDRAVVVDDRHPHAAAGRLRTMLDEIDEGFTALDWEYRFTHVNAAAARLLGHPSGDLLGSAALELWPELHDSELERAAREAMELGRSSIVEYETRDGNWLEARLYPTTVGLSVYFRDIDERKRLEREREELLEAIEASEQRARRKLESIVSPAGDLADLELGDLIDVAALQALMDDFYALAAIPMAVLDAKGTVLIGAGWQDICTQFHRVHPQTARHCLESDTELSSNQRQGEYRLYRCKNNMWDIATPITIDDRLLGYVFSGQFFFDDETVDRDLFAAQARRYGFNEHAYLAALERVPRLSHEAVDSGMGFFVKLAATLSEVAQSNIKLARFAAERDALADDLQAQGASLQRLTEELQGENEELQAQSDELAVQSEELRTQADDLAERARLSDALNAINRLIHSTEVFDQIMQRALDEGVRALGVEVGTIETRTAGGWLVRYQRGLEPSEVNVFLSDEIAPNARRAEAGKEPFAIADMHETAADVGFVAAHKLCAVLAAPLIVGGKVMGCLLFYGREVRRFTGAEIDFARKLGATVSLALENARQRGELEQAAALRYARSLIEASLDPLVTISAKGLITDVNEATEQATGLARDELIGTHFSDYFTEPQRARAGYRQVFKTGSVRDYPLAIRHTSGEIMEVLYNASLYRDESGEAVGVFAAARDVTERNRAQAAALENARLYQAERDVALTLQANFVHPLPEIAGIKLAALSLPAGRDDLIGGDFYDVVVRPDGIVVALIGDVTGKGIRAAGFTETVRAAVRTLALISPSPAYILGNVNRLILAEGGHRQLATALVLALDPKSGAGELASAGHPPAVQVSSRECHLIEPRYGLPLGVLEQGYETVDFSLARGDALVLYTDGLTEARRDGELFGERRLLATLNGTSSREPQELIDGLREAAVTFAGELRDDLQILVLWRAQQVRR
jgi:PAS domain S-box-containing protein